MANLSDAFGTMTIPHHMVTESPKEVIFLIQCIQESLGNAHDCTYFMDSLACIEAEINTNASSMTDDFVLSFSGMGRWAYTYNIDSFFESLEEKLSPTDMKRVVSLFQTNKDWLTFKFIDFEPGGGIFYEAIREIQPLYVHKKIITSVTETETQDLPITANHCMKYGIFELAFDEFNAHTLVEQKAFMDELSQKIPSSVVTADFLTHAWQHHHLGVYHLEDCCSTILDVFVDFYEYVTYLKSLPGYRN
ncbi:MULTISPECIES: hypothetical protein [Listeria]|uniref:hypothetical protein n=1 Tax=Listeria TaxID=1637 RepID=UPI000B593F15|nr:MULTISPECIES: hypothetical protein [Listeria]